MTQPRALFLADVLEDTGNSVNDAAAAELRRLHAQRDALMEALKEIEWSNNTTWQRDRARVAIKAVENT